MQHQWSPLFSVKAFVAANPGLSTETFALSSMQLKQLAIKVSLLRQRIEDKAKSIMLAEDATSNR